MGPGTGIAFPSSPGGMNRRWSATWICACLCEINQMRDSVPGGGIVRVAGSRFCFQGGANGIGTGKTRGACPAWGRGRHAPEQDDPCNGFGGPGRPRAETGPRRIELGRPFPNHGYPGKVPKNTYPIKASSGMAMMESVSLPRDSILPMVTGRMDSIKNWAVFTWPW